jgi:putative transcriptional regulator
MNQRSAIRAHRQQAGLTQAELALAIGTTRQTVSSWEAERTQPSVHLMPALAETLGAEPTDLVPGWEPDNARVGGPTRRAAA